MTQLSRLLLEKAEEIRLSSPTEVAVEHLKQAGYSEDEARLTVAQHLMEKEATEFLVSSGVDVEKAASMVKASGVNLKELTSFEVPQAEIHPSVDLLTKAAHYIDVLEEEINQKNQELEKAAQEIQNKSEMDEIVLPEPITKAASSGMFTNEDLAELQKIDSQVLNKLASAMDEPWEMGRGTGVARPKTDPLLEFMLG